MALEKVSYSFTSDLDGHPPWHVLQVQLDEALSTPYRATIELRVEGPVEPAIVGSSCLLQLQRGQRRPRRLCGLVRRASHASLPDGHVHLTLEVGPALLALAHSFDARVFSALAAPQIVEEVLRERLGAYDRSFALALTRSYPERDFCVQYNESDLDFVTRMLHEEGINFYFDHTGAAEKLVLVDDNLSFAAADAPIPIAWPKGEVQHDEHVSHFASAHQALRTATTFVDYDWTRPRTPIGSAQTGLDAQQREHPSQLHRDAGLHAYASPAYKADAAKQRVTTEAERHAALAQTQSGCQSSVTTLYPGLVVCLEGHPVSVRNGKYVVTGIAHTGVGEDAGPEGRPQRQDYANTFSCVPFALPCRPMQLPTPPSIPGVQTATVVGPEGEEVWTDQHGRVKLRFPWDRRYASQQDQGCWVRVLQSWAGDGYGTVSLPRVGTEVLVAFVDGHAQRPVVLGCAFNGANMTPYPLPEGKTRTVLRTRSTPGADADAFNELSFEDAAGKEEIYLRAQRDLRCKVEQNRSVVVGGDVSEEVAGKQDVEVEGDATWKVGGDRALTVEGTRTTDVIQDDHFEVGGDARVEVEGAKDTEIGKEYQLSVGQDLDVDVGRDAKVSVQGDLDLRAAKDVSIHADQGLSLVVATDWKSDAKNVAHQATQSYSIRQGQASIVVKDGQVRIDAKSIVLNGKTISLEAGGTLTAKGKKVSIS